MKQFALLLVCLVGASVARAADVVVTSHNLGLVTNCDQVAREFVEQFPGKTGQDIIEWDASLDTRRFCQVKFSYVSNGKGVKSARYAGFSSYLQCVAELGKLEARFAAIHLAPSQYSSCGLWGKDEYLATLVRYEQVKGPYRECVSNQRAPYEVSLRMIATEPSAVHVYARPELQARDAAYVYFLIPNNDKACPTWKSAGLESLKVLPNYDFSYNGGPSPKGQLEELEKFLERQFRQPVWVFDHATSGSVTRVAVGFLERLNAFPQDLKITSVPIVGGDCLASKPRIVQYYREKQGMDVQLAYCRSASSHVDLFSR